MKGGKLSVSNVSGEFDGIVTLEKDASVLGLLAEEFNAFNQAFNDATEYDAEITCIEVKYKSHIRYATVKLLFTHPINNKVMECKPCEDIFFEVSRGNDPEKADKDAAQNEMLEAWFTLEEAVEKKWSRLAGTNSPQLKMNFDGE